VLTGKGTSSKQQPDGSTKHKTVSTEGRTVAFRDWNADDAFAACQE